MNGVHDMGGMHGMGPIPNQKDEPVYHERLGGTGIRTDSRNGSLAKMDPRWHPSPTRADPRRRISTHELLREVVLRLGRTLGKE